MRLSTLATHYSSYRLRNDSHVSPPNPPLEIRLKVLSAIDYAPGNSIRECIKAVSTRSFRNERTSIEYRFNLRTISTWLFRYKKHGITTLENKTCCDKNTQRKVKVNELVEAILEVLPHLSKNKQGIIPKSVLYRTLLAKGLFHHSQLAPTTFYRMIREHQLLNQTLTQKLRLSFAMQYANELWQADTMHVPTIKQPDGRWRKTFFIVFIDDISRVITHGQFFYIDRIIGAVTQPHFLL